MAEYEEYQTYDDYYDEPPRRDRTWLIVAIVVVVLLLCCCCLAFVIGFALLSEDIMNELAGIAATVRTLADMAAQRSLGSV